MLSSTRVTLLLVVAACIASVGACSNVLGITDVPDGATPQIDASTDDGSFDFDSNTDTDGGTPDATKKDAATCISGGLPCGAFSGGGPTDPGGDCCSQFCIGNSDSTAGVCGESPGAYSITYDQTDATFLGAFLNNSFSSPTMIVNLVFPGDVDPTHQTSFAFSVKATGSGCGTNYTNFVLANGATFDGFEDDGGAACGLDVMSIPPDDIDATFDGTLTDSSNVPVTLDISVFQPYP